MKNMIGVTGKDSMVITRKFIDGLIDGIKEIHES